MKISLSVLILSLFCLISNSDCFSQDIAIKHNQSNSEISKNEIGTYQIQVINTRNHPYIPANIDEIVVKNRSATEVVFVTLGDEVRLKILPTSTLDSADFIPLDQVTFINK